MDMRWIGLGAALALAGCAGPEAARMAPGAPSPGDAPEVRTALDDTPRAELRPGAEAAQAGPAPAAGRLGRTVASLGNPAQGGVWLATGLVAETVPGRVTDPASGASAAVELRPSGSEPGSGSRLSMEGFQALGLPLTALPELEVARE